MKSHCVSLTLLVLVASVSASAQQTQQQLESLVQGYSIVLVQGDMQGGTPAEGVPKAAQQALSDMKDFLPYKSYSLLDSGWVLGPGNAHVRLRGPSGQDLEANISRWPDPNARPQELRIQFQLRDAVSLPRPAYADSAQTELINRLSAAEAQRQQLSAQYESARKKYDDNHPDVRFLADRLKMSAAQIDSLRRELERVKPAQGAEHTVRAERTVLISNSFTMRVGETVVVGTSRMGGDKALIALLTAVPRNSRKE
jgi:hypothetical protein